MILKINNGISKKILIPAFIQLFLISTSRFIIGPIIPLIASDLDMGLDLIGGAISLSIFILLVSTFLAGNLIGLFGLKKILYIAMALQTTGFAGFYFINSPSSFIILNSLLGVGGGVLVVCLITIANSNDRKDKTGSFFNLFLGAALALAVSPLLTGLIGHFGINWRYIFILLALIQAALIISFLFFRIPIRTDAIVNIKEVIKANKYFFKSPILILCFVFNFFNASVVETFYTWFTSYFSIFDVGINISSYILFLFSAAVFIGVFIKKYLIRYTDERKMLLYNVIFSIVFLTLNLFIDSLILKAVIIFLFGFSLSANYILIISLGLKGLKEKYSTASGYLQGAEFMGIIIFQAISGLLSEYLIKSGIIYMNIVLLLFLLVIVIILNSRKVGTSNG